MGMQLQACTRGLVVAAAALMIACGGDSGEDGSPSPPGGGGGGGGGGTVAATITITGSGVSPRNVTVPAGSRVMFVNSDTRTHDMHSDPHPAHSDCPELELVGFLAASQSRATGNLNTRRVCGFHDHNDAGNTSLQGTITIQ